MGRTPRAGGADSGRRCADRRYAGRRHAGFGLIEALVALLTLAVVMAAAFTLLDSSHRVTRAQTSIAEMQNNLRVAQQEVSGVLDLAGIGGLPKSIDPSLGGNATAGVFPTGLALSVDNNVAAGRHVGNGSTPAVVAGSDVLTVRGVFSTPVCFIEPQIPLELDSNGRISVVLNRQVDVGVAQDLEPLRRALAAAKGASPPRPEAFIVRDRFNPGTYAVLELDPPATFPGDPGEPTLTLGLVLADNGSQTYADEYGRLILGSRLPQDPGGNRTRLPDGTWIDLPRLIGALGLLEEQRFYVREAWDVAADTGPGDAGRPTPVLARARFYPGTGDLHPDGSVDLTDGILDLQVALGVDLPPTDGRILDAGDQDDEVLFNHPRDDAGLDPAPGTRVWADPDARLRFVRLNLVAQAPRPERDFEGVVLGAIEDHDHADATHPSIFNTGPNPKVRKRHLRTLVELRNLP